MKANDIIVLENNERYTLMQEIEYENEQYFFALGHNEKNKIDDTKPKMLKVIHAKDGEYVEVVSDESILINLAKQLDK